MKPWKTPSLILAAAVAAALPLCGAFAQQAPAAPQPAPAAQPAAPAFKIEAKADRPDAIYKQGETIIFKIQLLSADGKVVEGKSLKYWIKGDGGLKSEGSLSSAAEPLSVQAKLDKPGFVLCKVQFKPEGAEKPVDGFAGAGVDPLLIKSSIEEPADFDAFWAKVKEEVDAVPIKANLVPVEVTDQKLKGKVECFDIKIDCAGGMPVSAYLVKPVGAKPKSCPAYVSYHGAGVRSSNKPLWMAEKGCIAMDLNAHGLENGKPDEFYKALADGSLKDYRTRDCDKRDKIYFKGMFMRVIRSLEYIKSLPEWDGRILIVNGTSQGGGQALVAAGLDPQVTLCEAFVPALCHHVGILEGQESGWPRFIAMKDGQPANPEVVKAVPYYDGANFAKRIKCQSLLSTGFIDTTCSPTSVYVAFNNIPAKDKRIVNDVPANHGVPKETYSIGSQTSEEHIKKMREAAGN